MISTYLLLEDIKKHLAAAFSGIAFREPANGGNPTNRKGEEKYREPRIYVGQLPAKRSDKIADQGEDVPYILVKCFSADIKQEMPREFAVNVGILMAAFAPEDDPEKGMHDLLNMADRVVMAMSERRCWGDDHYCQELPISMSQGLGRVDDVYSSGLQVWGYYYMAAVTTQFKAAANPFRPPLHIVDQPEPKNIY